MRLYKMELFKLFQNKIFKIGMLAATGLLFLYFWFAEVGGEIATVFLYLSVKYKSFYFFYFSSEPFKFSGCIHLFGDI